MTHPSEKMISLNVAAFLATLQLVITDANDPNKVKGFGSGFLLRHKERLFFVTADHVIHMDDYDPNNSTGQRTGVGLFPRK